MMNKEARKEKIAAMVMEYKNGSEEAFGELYKETKDDLMRLGQTIRNTCYKDMDVYRLEDIVEMTFTKMYQHIDSLADPRKYMSWAGRSRS